MSLKKYDEKVLDKAIENLTSRRKAREPFSHVSLALRGEKRPRSDPLRHLSNEQIYESYSKDAEEMNQFLDNIINSKGKRKKTRRKNKKGKKTRRKNKKGKKTRRRRR